MTNRENLFISQLEKLNDNPGAMATLRRSLAFKPGNYPRAFPYVEPYVEPYTSQSKITNEKIKEADRSALYTVAGLYAKYPENDPQRTLARNFGELALQRGNPGEPNKSIEKRFIALLEADAENVHHYLRHAISLLAANDLPISYARLLIDLVKWMNPYNSQESRDAIRRAWAKDFYRAGTTEVAKP